jgi:predicted nucleotidyltransferase
MISTDAKLAELVRRLKEFAAANLECVILYGSAARGDFREGHSDLNLVCILHSLSVEELGRLAHVVKWWCVDQKEPAPLFFTRDELKNSADVFAIEILDMKHGRRVLYGADVVADIKVPMNLHRVQIEHDLRTILLKLREHYLRAGKCERTGAHLEKIVFRSPDTAAPRGDRIWRRASGHRA